MMNKNTIEIAGAIGKIESDYHGDAADSPVGRVRIYAFYAATTWTQAGLHLPAKRRPASSGDSAFQPA